MMNETIYNVSYRVRKFHYAKWDWRTAIGVRANSQQVAISLALAKLLADGWIVDTNAGSVVSECEVEVTSAK